MKNLLSHRMLKARHLEKLPKLPWQFTRLGFEIQLSGAEVSFFKGGDYVNLTEARDAVRFLADMLGMTVVGLPTSRKVIEQDLEPMKLARDVEADIETIEEDQG